jgi:hypothetical protein
MNIEALKNIKINARELQKTLSQETGEKVSYQSCLQELSKKYGFPNWNVASAYAKSNGIDILAAPITNVGAYA